MKAVCYLQIEPEWAYWDKTKLYKIKVKRVTQKKPDSPLPGVVVKLNLDIPKEAFLPLAPEATIVIPLSHTEAVTVESEPIEVVPDGTG